MAKRALGALLALAAAVAFVVAIVTSAWWSGHPVVDGRPISAKDVHVGLLGAEGCNTGGDGSCEAVQIGSTLKVATYAELAATGLAALLAFLLAIAAWRIADNRKGVARATTIATLIAGAGGGVVLALGPAIKASSTVEVPIGFGFFIFVGAVIASLIASTIARSIEPEPLRLKPSNAPHLPPAQQDIRQMLAGDGLRPTALGPEPKLGAHGQPAPRESAPLFNAAPQLRPLYDPNNAGYAPPPAALNLPTRAPTPMPQDQIEALTGRPSPSRINPLAAPPPPLHELDWSAPQTPSPQMEASRSKPMSSPPPLSRPTGAPPSPMDRSGSMGAPRSGPTGAPPAPMDPRAPIGTQPGSQSSARNAAAPPNAPRSGAPSSMDPRAPLGTQPGSQSSSRNAPPDSSRSKPTSVPPPTPGSQSSSRNAASGSRNAAPSVPPPVRPIVPSPDRTKAPSVPPPRAKPPTAAPVLPPIVAPPTKRASTIANAGASPAPDRTSSPSLAKPGPQNPLRQPTLAHAVPPMPRASTENDDRLATGMRETEIQTAVEIDHEAKARAQHSHRPSTEDVRTGGNRTVGDVTDAGINADAPPTETYEAAESTDVGQAPKAPEPFDANATIEQNPRGTETPVPTLSRGASSAAEDTPAPRAQNVPLSTAPSSLPPPKSLDPVPSGPTPACPQCESPMAWVDEHLRFYCRSCRMYF